MGKMVRVTTTDNPFNPFTEWDEWYFYDLSKGYSTCERLDRLSNTSSQLSDELNNEELEQAIDQMVEMGAVGKDGTIVDYVKVYK
ncbi:MAG: hypothetical protein MR841_08865 [Lactobacillus johnsonii]|nr:hypothetical protein [Lactobacillus johnsonii]